MGNFVNMGYGNYLNADKVIAVVSPESAPIRRLIQDSRENGRLLDCTCGRRTRSVIVTDSDHVILSAVQPETIAARLGAESADEADEQ